MSALRSLFSRSNLIVSWREQRSKFPRRTTPGVDGVTRDGFSSNIEREAEIISALVISGKYRFQRLRPIAIPKDDSKIRLINVPTIRDRFVQRVMLKFLVDQYRSKWKLPNSFSSMQGDDEGVHATIKRVSKKLNYDDFVIKADLSRYFDTIDRNLLKQRISGRVRHRSLHPLIFAAIDSETSARTLEEKSIFKKSGLSKSTGIRQGMPISPVLAYLFLMDVDRTMNANFFRYVDDLLFIGSTQHEVETQFKSYRNAAETRGLKVHELGCPKSRPKTVLIGAHESFDFLGISLKRTKSGNAFLIPSSSKARIEKQIQDSTLLDLTDPNNQKRWVLTTAMKASNLVRNYNGAYHICEDWATFERTLKELQLHMCRRIAKQLAHVEKNCDRELLLRVFGI